MKKKLQLRPVTLTLHKNRMTKGFILTRKLDIREAQHILTNIIGIYMESLSSCCTDQDERNDMKNEIISEVTGFLIGEKTFDDISNNFANGEAHEELNFTIFLNLTNYLIKKELIL